MEKLSPANALKDLSLARALKLFKAIAYGTAGTVLYFCQMVLHK